MDKTIVSPTHAHSQIEPPFDGLAKNREQSIRELLTAMGRRSRPIAHYVTQPACNAEA